MTSAAVGRGLGQGSEPQAAGIEQPHWPLRTRRDSAGSRNAGHAHRRRLLGGRP